MGASFEIAQVRETFPLKGRKEAGRRMVIQFRKISWGGPSELQRTLIGGKKKLSS